MALRSVETRQILGNQPNTVMHPGPALVPGRAADMNANGSGSSPYVSILQGPDEGTLWLHVQVPTGPLTRGPYGDLEEAQRAALALVRVARRRWAQPPGCVLFS